MTQIAKVKNKTYVFASKVHKDTFTLWMVSSDTKFHHDAGTSESGFDNEEVFRLRLEACRIGFGAEIIDLTSLRASYVKLSPKHFIQFSQYWESGDFNNKHRIEASALFKSILYPSVYYMTLASCGNIDFGQDPYSALCEEFVVPIDSIKHGSFLVNSYTEDNELGGGSFIGGDVFKNGKCVGRFSYNGRLWPNKEWESGDESLDELPK